jgi:hypothetical protein
LAHPEMFLKAREHNGGCGTVHVKYAPRCNSHETNLFDSSFFR